MRIPRKVKPLLIVGASVFALVGVAAGVPAFAGQPSPGAARDIVGGHEVTVPHEGMGSLQVFRSETDPLHHTCGALLDPSRLYAITAAHCVTPLNSAEPMAADLFHVRFGSDSRTSGGVFVGVQKILVNADWHWQDSPDVLRADLAVLKLSAYVDLQPFQFAPTIRVGAPATILGWGRTAPDGSGELPDKLQQLETKVLRHSNPRCTELPVAPDDVCIDNPNGTDGACRGDSGGPALQQVPGTGTQWIPPRYAAVGTLVGSVSPCGTHPFVYTDLTFWRNWIYLVITTGQVPPPLGSTPATAPAARRYQECVTKHTCVG